VAVVAINVLGALEEQFAFASSEQTVYGNVQGSYANTFASDNSYEVLTEVSSDGRPAKNQYSLLEHVWIFEITGNSLFLHAEAFHSANGEGDDFVLAGSFDGQNYVNLITVSKTNDDNNEQLAQIDGEADGFYYVRVRDTDHSATNQDFDTFTVDYLSVSYATGQVQNRPPIWADIPAEITGYPDTPITFSVAGVDPDGDDLVITLDGVGDISATGNGTADFNWTPTETGEYSATLTISDGEFAVESVVNIHVVDVAEPGTLYVGEINLSEVVVNKNFSTCRGVLTVLDLSDDSPIEGALVSATWSDLYNANVQGTTDGNGQVTFQTGNMRNPYGQITLTVTAVEKIDWTWDENSGVTEASTGLGGYVAGNGDLKLGNGAIIPEELTLNSAYPNPFNDFTTIRFGLPEDGKARVTIYNLLGKKIVTLTDGNYPAGWHSLAWNPRLLANGRYFVKLESGNSVKISQVVFVK